jgi:hypothetical protein
MDGVVLEITKSRILGEILEILHKKDIGILKLKKVSSHGYIVISTIRKRSLRAKYMPFFLGILQ